MKAFASGLIVGIVVAAVVLTAITRPDPRSQHAHDRALAEARQLTARRDTLVVRETVVRRTVDTLQAKAETLTVTIREALPDTLRPTLDSLIDYYDSTIAVLGSIASDWRELADSALVQRDSALAREARLLNQRKLSPLAVVIGIAATPRGIQPAITVGFRIGLPKIF